MIFTCARLLPDGEAVCPSFPQTPVKRKVSAVPTSKIHSCLPSILFIYILYTIEKGNEPRWIFDQCLRNIHATGTFAGPRAIPRSGTFAILERSRNRFDRPMAQ